MLPFLQSRSGRCARRPFLIVSTSEQAEPIESVAVISTLPTVSGVPVKVRVSAADFSFHDRHRK
jgi:hypothetical protein